MNFARLMGTAKMIGLSLEEFWEMDPIDFCAMCGFYLESHGKKDPNKIEYIDD